MTDEVNRETLGGERYVWMIEINGQFDRALGVSSGQDGHIKGLCLTLSYDEFLDHGGADEVVHNAQGR